MSRSTNASPLSHLRVIDLTRVRSGPTAARQFADWGADVVMVESRDAASGPAGARQGSDFENLHRNKRSICLDLKTVAGREALLRLSETADVLIENFRPAVKHRLGIDYETLRLRNPRLVYASISGFGEDGPYADRPGFDQIAQGMGGLMSMTGIPGQGPVRAGIAIADSAAGLYCVIAVMTALLERERTGVGRWVKTSLLQAQIALLDFQAARWLIDGDAPVQEGNHHPTLAPMGLFQTADGHVNIGAPGDAMFARLCALAGCASLLDDARFASSAARRIHRGALNEALGAFMRQQTSAYWQEKLNAGGVPCGPVYAVDQMFDDPQVVHLGMAQPIEEPGREPVRVVGQPFALHGAAATYATRAPLLGAHTSEVLREIGYGDEEVQAMTNEPEA